MANMSQQLHSSTPSRPVLLWVFRRDSDAITCGVEVAPSGRCAVRTVPHWNPSLSVVEPFDCAVEAMQRHAEVAHRLREIGWVVDHMPVQRAA